MNRIFGKGHSTRFAGQSHLLVSAQSITIRMHKEVLGWFRSRGRGYQTQINSLLRAYMEAHKAETTGAADGKRERTAGREIPRYSIIHNSRFDPDPRKGWKRRRV
ncbi:MAG: BrnA antitoxin family protein [Thermodesulfobacteriota bacterium]